MSEQPERAAAPGPSSEAPGRDEHPGARASNALVPSASNALVPVPTETREPATTVTLEPTTPQASEDALTATEDAVPAVAPAEPIELPTQGDPFPREAWTTLTSHAAGYLRLTLALLRDPAVSKHRRAALLAAAAYFASPIDLIPGIVPVLGQVDDLAVAMLAIRLALNALEPARRQQHLAAAGLSDETLHEDLVAVGRLAAWVARAGARTGVRVGRGALRVTVRTGRAAADVAVRSGRAAVRRATPMVDQATDVAGQAASSTGRRVSDAGRAGASAAAGRVTGAAGRVTGAAGRVTGAAGRVTLTGVAWRIGSAVASRMRPRPARRRHSSPVRPTSRRSSPAEPRRRSSAAVARAPAASGCRLQAPGVPATLRQRPDHPEDPRVRSLPTDEHHDPTRAPRGAASSCPRHPDHDLRWPITPRLDHRRRARRRHRLHRRAALRQPVVRLPGASHRPSEPTPTELADGRAIGSADAPATLEVWADFQCPSCGLFARAAEARLIRDYVADGQLRIVYRDFAFLGDESTDAAVAARAAEAQGQFWPYHDWLYANQAGENKGGFRREVLVGIAKELGLDVPAFEAALDDAAMAADVKDETDSGRAVPIGRPRRSSSAARSSSACRPGGLSVNVEAEITKASGGQTAP